jgi:IPT/TIG domain/Beta-propeller repeat
LGSLFHDARRLRIRTAALGAALACGTGAAYASAIVFEENLGQADLKARFLARGQGYVLFLTPRGAVLALATAHTALRMRWHGGREAAIAGEGLLEAKSHYLLGSDPKRWHPNVPAFERVRYGSVYPGVDLFYYGREGELEYDLVLAPGAELRQVVMDLSGALGLRVDDRGDLVLATDGGPMVWRKPVAYQVRDGERQEVESRYALRGAHRVGFEVGAYDRTRPLVLDPTLSYSTYLGGSAADVGHAIAVDDFGNAYVAGETQSLDFPGPNATLKGPSDAFVAKFDPSGTTRLYSLYLGGSQVDVAWGIAVDASGSVYLTGETSSDDFPTTAGAYQRVKSTGKDAFVVKLSAAGALAYSSLLGGSGMDQGDRGNAIAVDSAGSMVVTGRTDSVDFPVTAGAFFTSFRGGEFDAFVAKLNPGASGAASLIYSTYLGGSLNDAGFALALDSAGNPYVAGGTSSGADFPVTPGAYQASGNLTDAFFTKLNANASALAYSTFLGGSGTERANGIVIDAAGNALIAGQTNAIDFPTKNAIQPAPGGGYDAFVAKLDPAASGNASLVYSTYLGGSGDDIGRAAAVDPAGRVYVTGATASNADFPIANAVQPTFGGGTYDAFVTKIDAAGTTRLYSTYLGGSGAEGTLPNNQGGSGIAVSPCGDAWITGRTTSTNFPTASPFQPLAGGAGDAFVARISDPDPPTVLGVAPQWGPTAGGSQVTIVGGCFRPGAIASFGGGAATGVAVVSSSAITATTPAHAAGPVDVVVTNPGLPAATGVNAFTYGATGFFALSPCRVADTRGATSALGGPALAAGADRAFTVRGVCGIPASAGAISVNVTVTQGTGPGDLRLRPGGTPLPLVSTINYGAGQTRANNATLLLGPGGTVTVRSAQATGTVHLLLDVNGYYQ